MSRKRHWPAFTLIELLVVTAIIAVLAAIIVPVVLRAKERGAQTACLSNVRQIALATLMYVDEWGDMPWGNPEILPHFVRLGLMNDSGPTLKCPKFSPRIRPVYQKYNNGYALNSCLFRTRWENPTTIERPSSTVLVAEATVLAKNIGQWNEEYEYSGLLPGPDCLFWTDSYNKNDGFGIADQFGCTRHNGGANYALADGHIKYLRPTQIRFWESWQIEGPCPMKKPGRWVNESSQFSFQIY